MPRIHTQSLRRRIVSYVLEKLIDLVTAIAVTAAVGALVYAGLEYWKSTL